MAIRQVVTLRLPASRLGKVNRILESTALGQLAHRVLSDYKAIGIAAHEQAQ
jgi:hypothetical protein